MRRLGLRSFYLLLAALCVALVAGDGSERGIIWLRGLFLIGTVLFGSVALMPARKLEDAFLRRPPPEPVDTSWEGGPDA